MSRPLSDVSGDWPAGCSARLAEAAPQVTWWAT